MLQSNAPAKLVLPFAESGAKNAIPTNSQIGITPGAASLVDGFPPLTRTPLVAGGIPPSGLDFNGIFNTLSAIDRWSVAGGRYYYDGVFATNANIAGYPKGAVVLRTDAEGGWLNTVDNNVTDPEAGGEGWVPDFQYGIASVTMTNANVTLTALQAGRPIIVISGLLTANLNLILPNYVKTWSVINKTTGSFSITVKTLAGSGVTVTQNSASQVYGDGVNIETVAAAPALPPDASTTVKGIVELATSAETAAGTSQALAVTPGGLNSVLVGIVGYFTKNTAPAGWLKANGALVSRTTYAALFAEIGTMFGAGDGSTTFGLPDLRGEFIRGWDDARGVDSGRAFGSAQLDAMQGHRHSPLAGSFVVTGGAATGLAAPSNATTAATTGDPVADATNGTPRTANETRPRNVALLACIKF